MNNFLKVILVFVSLVFCITNDTFSQCNSTKVEWSYPSPQGENLTDVYSPSSSIAYAVGERGALLKTSDGSSWFNLSSGTNKNLKGIYFTDDNTGMAVGLSGTMLKTTNGGESWSQIPGINSNYNFNSIYFINKDTGFAVGKDITGPGYGLVLKTTDGGETWSKKNSNINYELYSVHFANSSIGFAGGWLGALLKTTDKGENWTPINISIDDVYSVFCTSDKTICLTDYKGRIKRSTDGGASWNITYEGQDEFFKKITFINADTGWAVGASQLLKGLVLKTTNGGISWSKASVSTRFTLSGISFSNSSSGYVVGDLGDIYMSPDKGNSFVKSNISSSPFLTLLNSIYFLDELNGYAAGWQRYAEYNPNYSESNFGVIMKTTNGGKSWGMKNVSDENISKIYFYNSNYGWAINNDGNVIKTIDGGTSWSIVYSSDISTDQDICFTDPNVGYAVGGTKIKKTFDGGSTWISQMSNTSNGLTAICFNSTGVGYISGMAGTILRSPDGGLTWSLQTTNVTKDLVDISSFGKDTIIAVGYGGTIVRTSDGGTTWTIIPSPITQDLNSINLVSKNIGYIGVANGQVLQTLDGGLTWNLFDNGKSYKGNLFSFPAENVGYCIQPGIANIFKITTTNGVVPMPSTPQSAAYRKCAGGTYTIKGTGAAEGETYYWYAAPSGGVPIKKGDLTLLLKKDMSYYLAIQNKFGCENTSRALVTIDTIPLVEKPVVISGNLNPCLVSEAYSIEPAPGATSYSWSLSGGGVLNATGTSANISWTSNTGGPFIIKCIPSNECGVGPESSRNISPTITPSFMFHAGNEYACLSGSATFSVKTGGTGIVYQWQEDRGTGFQDLTESSIYQGVNNSNGNQSTLTITSVDQSMANFLYRCKITDKCNIVLYSNSGTLNIKPEFSILTQPQNQTVQEGTPAVFALSMSGGMSLMYTWEVFNGNSFENYTSDYVPKLSFPSANYSDNEKQFRCKISDGCKTIISDTVTLNVTPIPTTFSFTPYYVLSKSAQTGSSIWGDYDNDNDLDVLVCGRTVKNNAFVYFTTIYKNTGNGFVEAVSLPGMAQGNAAWGDYDNDNDLDLIVTGIKGNNGSIKLFSNTENGFVEVYPNTFSIPYEYYYSKAYWNDYDVDGDLDILIAGKDPALYKNTGNGFERTTISLPAMQTVSADWGDFDQDGDPDLLLMGYNTSYDYVTKIYKNENSQLVEIPSTLPQLDDSDGKWIDYDNDGDLDILLSGEIDYSVGYTGLYKNLGGGNFSDSGLNFMNLSFSEISTGDFNNDGLTDFLLKGADKSYNVHFKMYRNTGAAFAEISTPTLLNNLEEGNVRLGDFDNDGDLDFLVSNSNGTNIYANTLNKANTRPSVPTNLSAVASSGNTVIITWDKATDLETPQETLTYNLSISSVPGQYNKLSPMADVNTGNLLFPFKGNVGSLNSIKLNGFSPGIYYYSIQAVDNGYRGSLFSIEKSFEIITPVLPLVETELVSLITSNSASVSANVSEEGSSSVLSKGFCWSTSPSPSLSDNVITIGTGLGSYNTKLKDLIQNSTYYVRAFATNNEGTSYGNELMFTTTTSTNIQSYNLSQFISIYPNPGTGNYNFSLNNYPYGSAQIKVINSNGILVYEKSIDNFSGNYNSIIDLTEFAKGIYCFSITSSNSYANFFIVNQ